MCCVVFFYAGFYKSRVLRADDEFILVLRGVILSALLTIAMTFAYRGAEFSRLTIALWCFYSVILIYLLRELDKALFRRLLFWVSGPQQILVIGKGKALEAIRQMTARQPFVKTHFQESFQNPEAL